MRSASLLFFLITFTLLIPPHGEWPRTAAQETAVTLWTGQATWTHEHHAVVDEIKVDWLRTVKLDFAVDSHRQVDPKTLKMFHGLNGSWVLPRDGGTITVRHEGSPGSDMREVLTPRLEHVGVYMSVKTCAPELSAPGAGLPDNTVLLNSVATPTVVWNIPRLGERRQNLGLVMKIQFPYKYDQTEFNPPEAEVPQMAAIGGIPMPTGAAAALNPPANPAKMKVTLKRKPLDLKYEPSSSDQLKNTVLSDRTHVTNFYATGAGQWFVHGNSRIQVIVDGDDASTSFAVSRFLTDWIQPIDPSGRRVGTLKGGGWKLDTERTSGGWIDVPGEKLTLSSNKWPQERYMQEYLVGVKGFPEFGGLYFIVVVDTKPNTYRVRMYPAKKITIDEWCAIKTRKTPYQTETSSGAAAVDSGWQGAR
ncbi:MAG TPA: hypothetical protein VGK88_12095 [bacterium]|jgi:hypothetical protein